MEEQKGLKFPLEWDKCPHCGSAEAVADMVTEEEKAKGKIGPSGKGVILQVITPIADPRIALLSVPVLVAQFDVCAKCGTLYCRRLEKGGGHVTPAPGQTPFQRPPMAPPSKN